MLWRQTHTENKILGGDELATAMITKPATRQVQHWRKRPLVAGRVLFDFVANRRNRQGDIAHGASGHPKRDLFKLKLSAMLEHLFDDRQLREN
jgi:hypothetical protein